MGITWVIGVLIVEVEELLPLAYIYNIMVAFQGVWILLFFVVFSKQVREECLKKMKLSKLFSKHRDVTTSSLVVSAKRSHWV